MVGISETGSTDILAVQVSAPQATVADAHIGSESGRKQTEMDGAEQHRRP